MYVAAFTDDVLSCLRYKIRKGSDQTMTLEENANIDLQEATIVMLHELGISIHRLGYVYLSIAVPYYATNNTQSLSKELYPYIANRLDKYTKWYAVERSIRMVVLEAWGRRDSVVWERYFPRQEKVPTNKQFVAVLAEKIRNPLSQRGERGRVSGEA